jgi:hypothetical protein
VRKCSGGELHWLKHNTHTGIKSRQKPHWPMNWHINNEGQEWKTSHAVEGTNGRGKIREGSKESEYGWCTFYTRMNIEY